MGFDIYKDKLIVYNHMIDLFDYILTLFDASYNADTLKRYVSRFSRYFI
ncbi:MAG: hypothetical protein ACFWUL_01115 [Dialister sp.]|jgi:hypothetical protein